MSKSFNGGLFFYLVSQSERQRSTSDRGTVSYGSQDQAGLSQELAGERLQDGGARLQGFGGDGGGRVVGGCLGVEVRSYDGEGLRRGGDGAVEHFLPGFFHLSKTEEKKKHFYIKVDASKTKLLMCNIKKKRRKINRIIG